MTYSGVARVFNPCCMGWKPMPLLLSAVLLSMSPQARAADDPFAQNVRTTEPLSPQDERKAFHLPPGFEIQLVASEPDITKPINLAFDVKGRLWVSMSQEYPFPSQTDQGRDAIKILSD